MGNHLENVPFHLMRQLLQEHTSQWQKQLNGITKQQYSVLCAVSDKPGIEQVELMSEALMTKATLAELLVRMEKKGLLNRTTGITDKRRRHIYLTPAGVISLESARKAAESVDAYFMKHLSNPQQQQLIELIKKMLPK